MQPEPLRDFLLKSDDGLAQRFLWMWPEAPTTFQIPRRTDTVDKADDDGARAALIALDDLTTKVQGRPDPVSVISEAVDLLQAFGQAMMDEGRGESA